MVVVSSMAMFTLQKDHTGYCEITLPIAGATGGGGKRKDGAPVKKRLL